MAGAAIHVAATNASTVSSLVGGLLTFGVAAYSLWRLNALIDLSDWLRRKGGRLP